MEEVTYESWGGRLMNSIKGVLIGIILFIVAFPVLFWNEGRAVDRAQQIATAEGGAVHIDDPSTLDESMQGKLVHMSGLANTEETLVDDKFNIEANAITLQRVAEMYQYKEKSQTKTEKKIGGGTKKTTTYSYDKVWSGSPIDSSDFHDTNYRNKNPKSMPVKSWSRTASLVTLGAYQLSDSLKSQMDESAKLSVNQDMYDKMSADIREMFNLENGLLYHSKVGGSASSPKIGDLRVTFKVVNPAEVSILASLKGNTFAKHAVEGHKPFEQTLDMGIKTMDEMFQAKKDANVALTWGLRFGGFAIMGIGIYLVLSPLVVVADVVPIIGNILGAGAFLVAALLSFGLSMITISIGWIFYRPLIGIPLFIVGVGGLVLLFVMRKSKLPEGDRLTV